MKGAFYALLAVFLGGGLFFLFQPSTARISPTTAPDEFAGVVGFSKENESKILEEKNLIGSSSSTSANDNIAFQAQLNNPPVVVRGIYITGWAAGSKAKMDSIRKVIDRSKVNAVVIDIKDYSGYVSYKMDVPSVRESGADKEIRIAEPNRLIKEMHDKGVYVIGRVTVFQDTILAKARPEWALKSKSNGGLWKDAKNLAWMDPASKETWDYVIDIAKDGFDRGFDEINFDYIRFPSDGNLNDAIYPFWDKTKPRHEVIREFSAYIRKSLPGKIISADLFGLVTVANDDLGIGQIIEDFYPYFDYIAPMIYPSHYAAGFNGYKNPAAFPYEVMSHSLRGAVAKRIALAAATSTLSGVKLGRLRPWIQDFDLGATYTPEMVQKELQSVEDVLNVGTADAYAGYLVWDPKNNYESYSPL